jgi:hypothetical protein
MQCCYYNCSTTACTLAKDVQVNDGLYAHIQAADCIGSSCKWNLYVENQTHWDITSLSVTTRLPAMKYARPWAEGVSGLTDRHQLPEGTYPIRGWGKVHLGPSTTEDTQVRFDGIPGATPDCARTLTVGTYPYTDINQTHP